MFDEFNEAFPRRRFYLQIGQFRAAQGVVGQYAFEAPWEGGYRVIPRFKTGCERRAAGVAGDGRGMNVVL